MTMTMMFLFFYVTQNKGIEENQGFTNSKNANEQIDYNLKLFYVQ